MNGFNVILLIFRTNIVSNSFSMLSVELILGYVILPFLVLPIAKYRVIKLNNSHLN